MRRIERACGFLQPAELEEAVTEPLRRHRRPWIDRKDIAVHLDCGLVVARFAIGIGQDAKHLDVVGLEPPRLLQDLDCRGMGPSRSAAEPRLVRLIQSAGQSS